MRDDSEQDRQEMRKGEVHKNAIQTAQLCQMCDWLGWIMAAYTFQLLIGCLIPFQLLIGCDGVAVQQQCHPEGREKTPNQEVTRAPQLFRSKHHVLSCFCILLFLNSDNECLKFRGCGYRAQ